MVAICHLLQSLLCEDEIPSQEVVAEEQAIRKMDPAGHSVWWKRVYDANFSTVKKPAHQGCITAETAQKIYDS
jgi:hypothetical protein